MSNASPCGMSDDQDEDDKNPKTPMENESNESDSEQQPAGEKQQDTTPMGSMDPKEEEWKENAKRIESDMETYAKDAAEDAGKPEHILVLEITAR